MAEQILVYGASGASKSTQCGVFHEYEAKRTGKPGIHICLDSSVAPLQDQIDAGMVKVWHLGYETVERNASVLTALNAISRGFVPSSLDPTTGARLSVDFYRHDGAVSIEGLYMISEALKQYFMFSKGMMNQVTPEADGSVVGTAQMQLYDMIKNVFYNLLTQLKGAPYSRILWTSHESKGTDQNGAAVLGPAILPAKGLDRIPAFFAHCLRLEQLTYTNAAGQPDTARLLHFAPHKDSITQLTWPAKTSLSPSRFYALRQLAGSLTGGVIQDAIFTRINEQGQVTGGILGLLQFLDAPKGATQLTAGQQLPPASGGQLTGGLG